MGHQALRTFARAWLPARTNVNSRERLRAIVGAGLGLLVTAALSQLTGSSFDSRWLVAPLGASAVLVFALPASPLAQPWSVLAGNTFSALVGVACARWVPDPVWASAPLRSRSG